MYITYQYVVTGRRRQKLPSAVGLLTAAARSDDNRGHKGHRAAERVDGHAAREVLEAQGPELRVALIDPLIQPAVCAPLPVGADRIDERYVLEIYIANT